MHLSTFLSGNGDLKNSSEDAQRGQLIWTNRDTEKLRLSAALAKKNITLSNCLDPKLSWQSGTRASQ